MGKVGRSFVLLLDADRVLSASEAELAAQVAASTAAAAAPVAATAPEAQPA
jgi:hypothetical protein